MFSSGYKLAGAKHFIRRFSGIPSKHFPVISKLLMDCNHVKLHEELIKIAQGSGIAIRDQNNLPAITAQLFVCQKSANFDIALEVLECFDEWKPKTIVVGLLEYIDKCVEHNHIEDALKAYQRLRSTGKRLDLPGSQRLVAALVEYCRINDIIRIVEDHTPTEEILVLVAQPLIMSGRIKSYANLLERYLNAKSSSTQKLHPSLMVARVVRSVLHARLRRFCQMDDPSEDEKTEMTRILTMLEDYHVKLSTIGGVADPSRTPSYFQSCQLYQAERKRLGLPALNISRSDQDLTGIFPIFEHNPFPYVSESVLVEPWKTIDILESLEKEGAIKVAPFLKEIDSSRKDLDAGGGVREGDTSHNTNSNGVVPHTNSNGFVPIPDDLTAELEQMRQSNRPENVSAGIPGNAPENVPDKLLYDNSLFPGAFYLEMRQLQHDTLRRFIMNGIPDAAGEQRRSLIPIGRRSPLRLEMDDNGEEEEDDDDDDDDDDYDIEDFDHGELDDGEEDDDGDDDEVGGDNDSMDTQHSGYDVDDDEMSVHFEITIPARDFLGPEFESESDSNLRSLIERMNRSGRSKTSAALSSPSSSSSSQVIGDLTSEVTAENPLKELWLSEDLFQGGNMAEFMEEYNLVEEEEKEGDSEVAREVKGSLSGTGSSKSTNKTKPSLPHEGGPDDDSDNGNGSSGSSGGGSNKVVDSEDDSIEITNSLFPVEKEPQK